MIRLDYHVSIHTRPLSVVCYQGRQCRTYHSRFTPARITRTWGCSRFTDTLPTTHTSNLFRMERLLHSSPLNVDTPNSGIAPDTHLLWGHVFPTPMCVFLDKQQSHELTPRRTVVSLYLMFLSLLPESIPFVLLQPHLRLEDILPNADLRKAAAHKSLPNLDAAFVGYIEESGSLFAMSPDTFPLVVFGDVGVGRFLDPAPDHVDVHMEHDLPGDLDSISRRTKERRLRRMCREGSTDRRCLTGVRKLGSSTQSRLSPTVGRCSHYSTSAGSSRS